MPWANFDDSYPDHPKVDGLTDNAFRLHTAAICHASKYRTDGFIAVERVPRLIRTYRKASVAELLRAGVWEMAAGGYQVHDYLDWNRSREQIEADAERKRSRARKGAEARWGTPKKTA